MEHGAVKSSRSAPVATLHESYNSQFVDPVEEALVEPAQSQQRDGRMHDARNDDNMQVINLDAKASGDKRDNLGTLS